MTATRSPSTNKRVIVNQARNRAAQGSLLASPKKVKEAKPLVKVELPKAAPEEPNNLVVEIIKMTLMKMNSKNTLSHNYPNS
jgi:hypothetical protein